MRSEKDEEESTERRKMQDADMEGEMKRMKEDLRDVDERVLSGGVTYEEGSSIRRLMILAPGDAKPKEEEHERTGWKLGMI